MVEGVHDDLGHVNQELFEARDRVMGCRLKAEISRSREEGFEREVPTARSGQSSFEPGSAKVGVHVDGLTPCPAEFDELPTWEEELTDPLFMASSSAVCCWRMPKNTGPYIRIRPVEVHQALRVRGSRMLTRAQFCNRPPNGCADFLSHHLSRGLFISG